MTSFVDRNQLGLASDDAGQKEAAIKHLEDETIELKKDMEDHKSKSAWKITWDEVNS